MQRLLGAALQLAIFVSVSSAPCMMPDGSTGLEEATVTDILGTINTCRKRLAKGEQKNGPGRTYLPKAAKIDPLQWSCDLESEASAALTAANCSSNLPPAPTDRTGLFVYIDYVVYLSDGEMFYWLYYTSLAPEHFSFDPLDVGSEYVTYAHSDEALREYANLVRDTTTKIGCASRICGDYDDMTIPFFVYCLTDQPELAVTQKFGSEIVYRIAPNTPLTTTYAAESTAAGESAGAAESATTYNPITFMGGVTTTTMSATITKTTTLADAAYCSGGSFSESEINCQILSFINHKRFELANGMQHNGYCGEHNTTRCDPLPRAKNMNKLTWSCDLERKASNALDNMDCAAWDARVDTGHGFAYFSEKGEFDTPDVIRAWVSGIDVKSLTSVSREGVTYLVSRNGRYLLDYANLMRSMATKIGCAHRSCKDSGNAITIFYCITDQPDLKEGDKIYETGSGSCDCTNFCDPTGLCTVSKPAPTCSEAIFPRPSNEDPDTICAHGDMTDALRILMMDMHNIRRAQLARGQLKYSGNMLPSATNMNRLVWSCALEKEAHDHLAKCPTEGYIEPTCSSPVDNFYRAAITSDLSTFKEMTIKTIRMWWDVYQNYPNPGSSALFTESFVGTPIESYTRMGWAQTREIGCSIAKCGDEYLLSCLYRPNGNVVNNPMYNVGLVCSECYIFGAGSCGSGGLCG